jgi:hypothetical protein
MYIGLGTVLLIFLIVYFFSSGVKRLAHSIPEHRANPRKLFVIAIHR